MRPSSCFVALSVAGLLSACGTDSFFARAEGSCIRYPTPDARADCEQRLRQALIDFTKQQAQDQKVQRDAEKEVPSRPSTLCFKRQVSGEIVCPN